MQRQHSPQLGEGLSSDRGLRQLQGNCRWWWGLEKDFCPLSVASHAFLTNPCLTASLMAEPCVLCPLFG